jgi:hypothetical protein
MSDIQIPAPVLANLRHAAEETGKALAAQAREDFLSPQIDALAKQLAELRRQHAAAGTARAAAEDHADMYRRAAHGLAATLDGLDRQSVETAEPSPIVPPLCERCGLAVHRDADTDWWMHDHTGASPCNPDDPTSPYAQVARQAPASPQITTEDPLNLNHVRPDQRPVDGVIP